VTLRGRPNFCFLPTADQTGAGDGVVAEVAALAHPDYLIEIEAIAIVRCRRRPATAGAVAESVSVDATGSGYLFA
jgi:hypothetical protein